MASLAASVALASLFADPSRVRLLSLLDQDELTVAELVAITGLTQSRVSTHLGKLREAGVVRARTAGAAAYQGLNQRMPEAVRSIWAAVRGALSDAVLEADARKREAVLRARRSSGSWLESVAGEMERHYSPGRTWETLSHGLLGLARPGDVLDVGAGDGFVTGLLATRARTVTCLDLSEKMVAAARKRLGKVENVRFVVGDMHALPFEAGSFDEIALFNVLTYSEEPLRVLGEAARVLRSGGSVSVTTLNRHEHAEETAPYGHVTPGFSPAALRELLRAAGLSVRHCAVVGRERRAPHFETVAAYAELSPAARRKERPRR